MKLIQFGALSAMLALAAFAIHSVQAAAPAAIGQPAPTFSLQDQNGKIVSLADFAGKIVVLEWVNPNCPFVKRHYQAKTMSTLADEFAGKGVAWVAINSTKDATNDFNKAWVSQNSLAYPILNDSAGTVGHAYGAKTTPDMFIINKDGILVYSGGIDNDPDGDKGSAKVNYVNKALSELTAGETVSMPQTKSYGCSVKYAN